MGRGGGGWSIGRSTISRVFSQRKEDIHFESQVRPIRRKLLHPPLQLQQHLQRLPRVPPDLVPPRHIPVIYLLHPLRQLIYVISTAKGTAETEGLAAGDAREVGVGLGKRVTQGAVDGIDDAVVGSGEVIELDRVDEGGIERGLVRRREDDGLDILALIGKLEQLQVALNQADLDTSAHTSKMKR